MPGPQYRSKEGIRFFLKAKPEDGNPKQLGSISWQALPGTTPQPYPKAAAFNADPASLGITSYGRRGSCSPDPPRLASSPKSYARPIDLSINLPSPVCSKYKPALARYPSSRQRRSSTSAATAVAFTV